MLTLDELKMMEEKVAGQLGFNMDWKNMFKRLDLDGDGRIDFGEFFAAAIKHQKVVTDRNIQNLFETFDQNNDGMIDIKEF